MTFRSPLPAQPKLALIVNDLGFGGTQRGLLVLARTLCRRGRDVRVIAARQEGPLAAEFRGAGIDLACASGDADRLSRLLNGVDVALVSRAGNAEPLIPSACRLAGVGSTVEWSIFGSVDQSSDRASFAAHLFISKMCWLRYRDAVGGGDGFFNTHRVLYLPLDYGDLQSLAPSREQACSLLGLDPQRPVVSRIGRSADLKWRHLLVDMIPELIRRVPEVQVVLVGTTDRKLRRLERRGVLERCKIIEPSPDRRRLATFLAASDVTVNAAAIGESQGLAIAESLALGVPVVTCSTPWVDNAQVEFVEHGVSGLVANHPTVFAEAVSALLLDRDLRSRLGEQGRQLVERELNPEAIASQVEALVDCLAAGKSMPDNWRPSIQSCNAFLGEYHRRLGLEYRPLTLRERTEAFAARAHEKLLRAHAVLSLVRHRKER